MLEAFVRIEFCSFLGSQSTVAILVEQSIQAGLFYGREAESKHPLGLSTVGKEIKQVIIHS